MPLTTQTELDVGTYMYDCEFKSKNGGHPKKAKRPRAWTLEPDTKRKGVIVVCACWAVH